MIPDNNTTLKNGIKVITYPTYTYKLDIAQNQVRDYTDKQEAMKQVIYKIIYTERYQYLIYDWNYGIELNNLFGKPKIYVRSELKRRIIDALMADDRIKAVRDFVFSDPKRNTIAIRFAVDTIYGVIDAGREVSY